MGYALPYFSHYVYGLRGVLIADKNTLNDTVT